MKTPRKSSSLTKDDLTVDNDSVKRDLLSLGIDLDESLIDRMRRNLGISTSFEAVARASTIVRSRNSQVIGSAPDVILRSVEKEETEKVSPRSAQPSLIQVPTAIILLFCSLLSISMLFRLTNIVLWHYFMI